MPEEFIPDPPLVETEKTQLGAVTETSDTNCVVGLVFGDSSRVFCAAEMGSVLGESRALIRGEFAGKVGKIFSETGKEIVELSTVEIYIRGQITNVLSAAQKVESAA